MVEGTPLENNAVVGRIDLLKKRVHNPSDVVAPIDTAQVVRHLLVNTSQKCLLVVCKAEFMLIQGGDFSNGLDRPDDFVILVHYNAMATSVAEHLSSLEKAKMRSSHPVAGVEIMGIVGSTFPEA